MSAVVENKQEEDFPSLQLDLNTGMRRGLAGLKQKQMARCYATVVQSDYFPRLPCYKFLPSHYTTLELSVSPDMKWAASSLQSSDVNKQTQASLLRLISIAAALTSRIEIKNIIVKLRLHHSLQPRIFFLPGVGRSSPDFHSIPCLIPNVSRFIVAPSYDL